MKGTIEDGWKDERVVATSLDAHPEAANVG